MTIINIEREGSSKGAWLLEKIGRGPEVSTGKEIRCVWGAIEERRKEMTIRFAWRRDEDEGLLLDVQCAYYKQQLISYHMCTVNNSIK